LSNNTTKEKLEQMAIEFINPVDAVSKTGLKLLVYGPAGSGKTVLCATAKEPTLIISAEAGLLSIKGAPTNIKIAEVHSREEFEEVLNYLKTNGPPAWVCIDSITEVAQQILEQELTKTKMPMKAYGELSQIAGGLIRELRDLPCNVVMTCKEKKEKDESKGMQQYSPKMPGQALGADIAHHFDVVGAMRIFKEDDRLVHYLQCHHDEAYEAKDRSGKLATFEKPNLAALKKKIEGATSTTKKAA
jgi:energy-coupling factor transporter ATP-binding protein EcfA2